MQNLPPKGDVHKRDEFDRGGVEQSVIFSLTSLHLTYVDNHNLVQDWTT